MKLFHKLKWAAAALFLALLLSACTIPVPGFADYDVSAYIQALLDSSYHESNDELIAIAKITEEKAKENNTATVENAAITFCNIYGISPNAAQLEELKLIMKQAFALSKYTVKEERKTEEGYYLEVEVASITNFQGREADFQKLKLQAKKDVAAAYASPSVEEDELEEDEEEQEPELTADQLEQAEELYIEKVLDFGQHELANISYDSEPHSVALDIRQTEEGELQLDLYQINAIDKLVVRFE